MTLTDLQFAAPWLSLLMFCALLILFLFYRRGEELKKVQGEIHAAGKLTSPQRLMAKGSIFALAWIFLVLALMGPRGNPRYIATEQAVAGAQEEITFLVDVSSSMGAFDRGKSATRLGDALQIADDVAGLPFGGKLALIPFTSIASTLVPLSYDRVYFRIALRDIGVDETGVAGTDLVQLFKALPSKEETLGRERTYILLTDGEDTLWQTAEDPQARFVEIQEAFNNVGGRWIIVGFGGDQPVPLKGVVYREKEVTTRQAKGLLQGLAGSSALYLNAFEESAASTAEKIMTALKREEKNALSREVASQLLIYTPYFQWPLLAALLLFIWGFTFNTGGRNET